MNHPTIFQKRTHGFTLIELLTVIAIIGVLAGILIPVIGSARKTAASTAAVSNIRQIGMANMLYTQENLGEIIGYGETPAILRLPISQRTFHQTSQNIVSKRAMPIGRNGAAHLEMSWTPTCRKH